MRILVAMSGGVDSSVAAHLLQQDGHDLVGVRFLLWTDPDAPAAAQILPSKCCNPQTIHRANTVAQQLGFPLHHVDIREEFKEKVVDHFLAEYQAGNTPNPCVLCNRVIKFAKLLELAEELGCDKVATGHYARIEKHGDAYRLLEAADKRKTQSYFLYSLSQETLSRTLFPLGAMRKEDVIALGRTLGIPLPAQYEESQDVCFYPEKEPQAFLRRHLRGVEPGDIRDRGGRKVGMHRGLPFYTIGQRKGLGVGGLKVPLHVVEKDRGTNAIVVAPSGADLESVIKAKDLRMIRGTPKDLQGKSCQVRVCSQGKKHRGKLEISGEKLQVNLAEPIRGIAPGQAVVLYDGHEILGGATICADPGKRAKAPERV
ncbi:MAG: tRNA 2-thiouridine(34) synthase MnmA [Candidatus Peribacteraceae bacterium]|nr:tRNA 2-thiouridine(34) synthase MnmA [Candidatus Peribacteraceae bacterium]